MMVVSGFTALKDVVYKTVNGMELSLDILIPDKPVSIPCPAVMYIHGGGWNGGDKQNYGGQVWNASLAQQGFVAINVNYRFSSQAIFPAQIIDLKDAVQWIRAHAERYGIHPGRIGVWGHSAGGHLAALLGTSGDHSPWEKGEISTAVQAACSVSGGMDLIALAEYGNDAEAALIGATLENIHEHKELADLACPMTHIHEHMPPFLIIHGEEDAIVPIIESEKLYAKLDNATFIKIKNGDHFFIKGNLEFQDLVITVAHFFRKQLIGTARHDIIEQDIDRIIPTNDRKRLTPEFYAEWGKLFEQYT
ncbi:alpha/beta hydrolase [Paenibacillus maysiensis]|uniref:alpha/beta hydrolase n=1 Tax=Paenibacillus maysiensis TaxID=1155954 RepID=UPI000472BB68|nr:alpha/beta hydrolase [Paenibacillus maysiensis]